MWKHFPGLIDLRGQRAKPLIMALFFFLAMATFWALKPMKRGMLVSYHREHQLQIAGAHLGGAQAEQLAKVANVVAALMLALVFSYLTRRLSPRSVVAICCSLFVLAFLCFIGLLRNPGIRTVWSFYIFGDMFNTLMVTLSWALMNDSVEANEAKRLYGAVGLGGVVGGTLGATLVFSSVGTLGRGNVLLLCVVATAIMGVIGYYYARMTESRRRKLIHSTNEFEYARAESATPGLSVFKGLRLLASSRYLLTICLLVIFYEVASNIVDFQLSTTVEQHVAGGLERDRLFGLIGQVQGVVSILVQVFLTSFVMRKLGVGAALMVLPGALLFGSVGFLLLPTVSVAALMSVIDNSMNYSINQSAKEVLYVPTTAEEKFQAKAFIDMFVQRFAKVIAVGLNLGLMAYVSMPQVRWLSVASIVILTLWISKVRFAGGHFERLTGAAGLRRFKHATTENVRRVDSASPAGIPSGSPALEPGHA